MSGGLTLFAVWVPCFFLAPRARQVAVLLLAPMFFALSRMLSNRERGECLAAFAFGALLPLLPMLGSGTLLVSALIYLWLHPRRLTPKSMEFILPVLMVLGVWTLLQLWFEFDASLWKAVWMGEGGSGQRGVEGVLRFIRFSPPAYLVTFQCLVRFLLIFMLFEHFRQAPGLRRVFWQGLMWGLIPAAALSMFQILSGNLSLFPNLGEYWQALGRFSGTFSDPNAFGIFVVLALPLMTLWSFAPKVTRFWMLLPLVWVVLGLFSGSRTFFVGLFFYLVVWLYVRHRKYLIVGAVAALSVAAVLYWERQLLPDLLKHYKEVLPVGVLRLLASLSWDHLYEACFSRIAFIKVGGRIWLDHIFYGVGFEQFRELVFPYTKVAGVEIGTWSDNANNFYLGILAQTGLVGFFALLLTLNRISVKSGGESSDMDARLGRSARRVVACLALLLFLGPHIEFDEIAVLTGFLLGCGFDLRPSRLSPGLTAAFMALLCAPIIFTAKSSQYGLYPWEKGPDGYFRWSGKNARVSLECAPDAKHRTVVFRALTPNMQADPVILEVGQPGSFQVLMMQEPGLYSATVSCGKALVVPARLNEANFDLTLSRIWTPSKQVEGGDQRLLGVQVVGE